MGSAIDTEISLLDLAGVLARRRTLIAAAALGAMAAAAAVVLMIPPAYTAEAVILPPQLEQLSPALPVGGPAGMGSVGALGAVASATGFWRNPTDLYIGVLKSRTIADALIARFELPRLYGYKGMDDTRRQLARRSAITSGKDLLIRVRVEDRDAHRAAGLANGYVEELEKLTSRLAFTAATRRRMLFEGELGKARKSLADAEVALKNVQQSSGLVVPSGQAEALVRAGAQLRAEIAGREVQLESMRTYATPDHPRLQLLERETAALRAQLEKLKAGGGGDDLLLSTSKLPAASLEYLRRLRDLKYYEMLYELLSRHYEAARLDEARSAPLVQVVDRAIAPERKSWPPRVPIVLASGLVAALAACAAVLLRSARVPRI